MAIGDRINKHLTDADQRVLTLLEDHFADEAVFFLPIVQPAEGVDGYWHFRMKSFKGVAFARQNGLGEVVLYGPMPGKMIGEGA